MLYRVVLLLGVARVSGFAQTPSEDLSGRGQSSGPSPPPPGVCDSWGLTSEGCRRLIDDKTTKRTSLKAYSKKMCYTASPEFCYPRWSSIQTCADLYKGCQTDRGSTQCQNYERMRRNLQCPTFQEGGESDWCRIQMVERDEVSSCAGLSQSKCGNSYTRNQNDDMEFLKCPKNKKENDEGCVTGSLMQAYEANDMYQQCEWNKGVCRGAKGMQGDKEFDAVTFCGAFCERRKSAADTEDTEDDLVPLNVFGMDKKCNQGNYAEEPADYPNGLPARLSSPVACKRNYFQLEEGWTNGCDFYGGDMSVPERMDWGANGGPCEQFLNKTTNNYEVNPKTCTQETGCQMDWEKGIWKDCTGTGPIPTSRCDPKSLSACSDDLLAECRKWPWTSEACGKCNPACNCMGAEGTPCGPAQVLCCDDDKECRVCSDVDPPILQDAYVILAPGEQTIVV